jgi:DNA modification methylase
VSHSIQQSLERVLNDFYNTSTSKGARSFGFYWTRKSAELAKSLIEEFCPQTGAVLDPFMGSGSTALGLKSADGNRLFIGVELNEMPIQNLLVSLGKVDDEYALELEQFKHEIAEVEKIYIFQLTVGLFKVKKVIHHVIDSILQPTQFIGELDGRPATTSHEHNPEIFEELKQSYVERIADFQDFPDFLLSANSRIAVKPGMAVSDVFGPLGFAALAQLRSYSTASLVRKLIIGASIHLCRLTDSRSQSQFPFWYPKQHIHEKSVFEVIEKKYREFLNECVKHANDSSLRIIDQFEAPTNRTGSAVLLLHGSASAIMKDSVPTGSIDLVITDPPYFDQVAYSEYLKLWEFFTGFEADLENEIVESGRVNANKSREVFLRDLEVAFSEVRRTMKEGALALVYFKDSKPRNLHDFIFCLERAGLRYESQVHLAKATYTYKQNSSKENTVGGDAILAFTAVGTVPTQETSNSLTIAELDKLFLELFSDYIAINGPSTLTEALDNSLIRALYPTGYLAQIKKSDHLSTVAKRSLNYDPHSRKWSSN